MFFSPNHQPVMLFVLEHAYVYVQFPLISEMSTFSFRVVTNIQNLFYQVM